MRNLHTYSNLPIYVYLLILLMTRAQATCTSDVRALAHFICGVLTLAISSHKLSRVAVGFEELRVGDWTLRTDANDFFAPHFAGGGLGTLSLIVARDSAALVSLFASTLGLFCLRLEPPCFLLSVLLSTAVFLPFSAVSSSWTFFSGFV